MDKEERCRRKRHYDTEFEAIVTMRRQEKKWNVELLAYPCGKHWHIANKDPALRNKHPSKSYCEACQQEMRPGRWKIHQKKHGHLRAIQRIEKERG